MEEKFEVAIEGLKLYPLSSTDVDCLDIAKISDGKFHILMAGKSYMATIKSRDFFNKQYVVAIGKKEFVLTISNSLDLQIDAMGFEASASGKINNIIAPMPGLILNVAVETGQEVKENQPLLILEAMKMENVLTAPRDGVIKNICCSTGDAVEKTQLLVEFEN